MRYFCVVRRTSRPRDFRFFLSKMQLFNFLRDIAKLQNVQHSKKNAKSPGRRVRRMTPFETYTHTTPVAVDAKGDVFFVAFCVILE